MELNNTKLANQTEIALFIIYLAIFKILLKILQLALHVDLLHNKRMNMRKRASGSL